LSDVPQDEWIDVTSYRGGNCLAWTPTPNGGRE
jgi:hypothetical protein